MVEKAVLINDEELTILKKVQNGLLQTLLENAKMSNIAAGAWDQITWGRQSTVTKLGLPVVLSDNISVALDPRQKAK